MSQRLDLNADLGEGCAFDAELMSVITSCNIACGGHAGDAESMRLALERARDNGVAAGVHPSFPDRANFGRSKSDLSGAALEAILSEQVRALKRLAEETGIALTHLKPHGALYNMAALDADLAVSIVNVLVNQLPGAALYGPPQSQLQKAATSRGIAFVAEGFADRAYEADGRLRDRKKDGAVLHAPADQTEQAVQIATQREVTTYDGGRVALPVETICVHGDTPTALEAARAIKSALMKNGISLCPPG